MLSYYLRKNFPPNDRTPNVYAVVLPCIYIHIEYSLQLKSHIVISYNVIQNKCPVHMCNLQIIASHAAQHPASTMRHKAHFNTPHYYFTILSVISHLIISGTISRYTAEIVFTVVCRPVSLTAGVSATATAPPGSPRSP